MASDPKTLVVPVTPSQYAAMQAEAAQNGLTIAGEIGTASKAGITVGYAYDGTTLTLALVDRSWYDPPADSIMASMRDMVAKVTGAA